MPVRRLDVFKLKGYDDVYRIRVRKRKIVYRVLWSKRKIIIIFEGPRVKAY